MGTLLQAPRIAQSYNKTNRPRPVVPIVPAIPRLLNATRKQQPMVDTSDVNGSLTGPDSSNERPIEWDGGGPLIVDGSAPESYVNGGDKKEAKPVDAVGNGASVIAGPEEATPEDQNQHVEHDLPAGPRPEQLPPYIFPPPFYPATHRPAPLSLPPPTLPYQPPQINHLASNHSQKSHASNGNIVFGDFAELTNSSPALPLSPSDLSYLPQVPPHYAPGWPEQHFSGTGHAHHLSDRHSNWFHRPPYYTTHPHHNIYDPERQSYAVPPDYHARIPSFLPPEDHSPYTPSRTPTVHSIGQGPLSKDVNLPTPSLGSHSLSGSVELNGLHPVRQSEGGAYAEIRPESNPHSGLHQVVASDDSIQPSPLQGATQSGVSEAGRRYDQVDMHDSPGLTRYLLSQFNKSTLSDYCLQLSQRHGRFEASSFYLHGLLISRSPVLAELMGSAKPDGNGCKHFHMEIADDSVRPDAFELALQHLYGHPLLEFDSLVACDLPLSAKSSASLQNLRRPHVEAYLELALAYAAAGAVLQIPSVRRRGYEIVSRLISWGTLERILSFALQHNQGTRKYTDGHGSTSRTTPDQDIRKNSANPVALPNGDEKGSIIERSFNVGNEQSSGHDSVLYGDLADGLLRDVAHYVVTNFPSDFQLQTSAPPLPGLDRLPTTAGSRPSVSHPRLSFIQFGDRPSEEEQRPDAQSATLSKVLLSVPFPLLKDVFDRLPQEPHAQHAQQIIDERERRRHCALRSKEVPLASPGGDEALWNEAGWEESLDKSSSMAGGGVQLTRRWTGLRNRTRTKVSRR